MKMKMTVARPHRLAVRAVFGVLALGCVALPTMAGDVAQREVNYSDLDVVHTPGATALYRRIAAAAERVCWNLKRTDLRSKRHFKTCVNKAIEDAVTSVNQPTLLAVYQAKQGSRPSIASVEAQQVSAP